MKTDFIFTTSPNTKCIHYTIYNNSCDNTSDYFRKLSDIKAKTKSKMQVYTEVLQIIVWMNCYCNKFPSSYHYKKAKDEMKRIKYYETVQMCNNTHVENLYIESNQLC